MRLNIQTKLSILLAGLAAALLIAVVYAISLTLSTTIKEKVVSDFRRTQNALQKIRQERYERLIDVASVIGQNSTFKANVEIEKNAETVSVTYRNTVLQSLREFGSIIPLDLMIVTNKRGLRVSDLMNAEQSGDDLKSHKGIRDALNGEPAGSMPDLPELWGLGGELFQTASTPVAYLDGTIIGTLTLGTKIKKEDFLDLKGNASIDFAVFLKDKLLFHTGDTFDSLSLVSFGLSNRAKTDLTIKSGKAGDTFEGKIGETEVFGFIAPLGSGEEAAYVGVVPKSTELQLITTIQKNILIFSLISLLVAVGLAALFGRLFSKPVTELAAAMTRVQQGDLSVSVTPRTNDEVGELATSFNNMILGLRERLQLSKYVGSHTREMVRELSGGDMSAALGGSRQEITVLFSDVRGFTAFSEKHPPEEVIAMLNKYLGFQAKLVTEYGGSVDKFVGDEMVALFAGKESLKNALACAIAIQRRADEVQRRDDTPVYIGIGVNYGTVVLGNMGSEDRLDYTVIGSAVNLGARLCSAAKAGQILVRKELLDTFALHHEVKLGAVQPMTFKGVSSQLDIAEVIH
jgi:class 3 adenylate cyclase